MSRANSVFLNVDEYMTVLENEDKQEEGLLRRCFSLKNAMQFLITFAASYNIVFIPLSLAFRIPFEGVWLTLEILTIFLYLVDICLRWTKLSNFY